MNKSSLVLVLLANFLTGGAIAGTMGQPDWAWVGTLSMGPTWQSNGVTQTFYLAPEIEKTYVANQTSNTLFNGELFVGLQDRLSQTFYGQIGLALAVTSDASLSGVIWDDADPEFNNYTYSYKIQHTQLTVKSKLLADMGYWLDPWISGSLGVGFNSAHSFGDTPTIFEALPNPNFGSHAELAWAYSLGVGVQKVLNEDWQIGVGYEFEADWGKSSLGRAEGQTLNSGLWLDHLYSNGILFSITYVA